MILGDIRYILRQLWKSPAFTLTTILTLAVAIGANLTAIGIAKAIFFDSIPVAHPEELIAIYGRAQQGQGYYTGIAYSEFQYYREHNDVLSALAGYWRVPLHLKIGDVTESIIGETVTADFFSALPVQMALGRVLSTTSMRGHDVQEIVLSYSLWQNRFNGRSDVLGKTVTVEGIPLTIVGVVGPKFSSVLMDWQDAPQFWVPMDVLGRSSLGNLLQGLDGPLVLSLSDNGS